MIILTFSYEDVLAGGVAATSVINKCITVRLMQRFNLHKCSSVNVWALGE